MKVYVVTRYELIGGEWCQMGMSTASSLENAEKAMLLGISLSKQERENEWIDGRLEIITHITCTEREYKRSYDDFLKVVIVETELDDFLSMDG